MKPLYAILLVSIVFGCVNAHTRAGFFDNLFGAVEKPSDTITNGNIPPLPKEDDLPEGHNYWDTWTDEYRCTQEQHVLVEQEMNLCIAGKYKPTFCFANAKRLYCDKYINN